MSDKRSVHTDALETLGTIIEGGGKDAIHLAVYPVEAGVTGLKPGQDIGIADDDGLAYGSGVKKLGIVDPFLKKEVKKGERFWLIVYPRQITSLRHVWEHPDFPATEPVAEQKDMYVERIRSEAWLKDYIDNNDLPTYENILTNYLNGGVSGDSFYFGEDASGSIPDEFWDHMEIVLGQKITDRAEYFSCSC